MTKKICAIGGEGIGIEVVAAAVEVLKAMDLDVEIVECDVGEPAVKKFDTPFPKVTKDAIDDADAILFGATEEKGILAVAYLRFGLQTYANVRPFKYYPGIPSPLNNPEKIDFVFVRENLEGLYAAPRIGEGSIRKLAKKGFISQEALERDWHGGKGVFAVRIATNFECERIARFACELTVKRKNEGHPGKLTIVHKENVLRRTDGLFVKSAYNVAEEYIHKHGIIVDDYYVDDQARRILRYPGDHDVMVLPNEFGDILSDMSAELVGGLGVAPSACIGEEKAYFEPCHGSAPKYYGLNVANPIAAILSSQMMLDYLGFTKEAAKLEAAVAKLIALTADPIKNWRDIPRDFVPADYRDQQKFAKTTEIAQNIIKFYKEL
ncbi:MAG: isocitrate/isopropylmalate dehydrogenase family protein [Candidatus Helarchaeota archaeon]|nr:isocitrate/isopropylmalate dehydrogenase family protein [Candidatus Helarchaeota archaeon]